MGHRAMAVFTLLSLQAKLQVEHLNETSLVNMVISGTLSLCVGHKATSKLCNWIKMKNSNILVMKTASLSKQVKFKH